MDDISTDPIIIFYTTLADKSQHRKPQFSEMSLRLAFTRVLGTLYVVSKNELEMYKSLLLLYYARKYSSTEELFDIMTCFDVETIEQILENKKEIMHEWHKYTMKKIVEVVYLDATKEMLKEWRHRLQCHSELNFNLNFLEQVTVKIFTFLDCQADNRGKFINRMYRFLSEASTNRTPNDLESNSLNLADIYEYVKPKLNSFVVQNVEKRRASSTKALPTGYDEDELELVELIDVDDSQRLAVKLKKLKPPAKRRKYTKRTNKLIIEVEEPTELYAAESTPAAAESVFTIDCNENDSQSLETFEAISNACINDETDRCELMVVSSATNDDDEEETLSSSYQDVIDQDTAHKYLESLKLYALANKTYEALDLLEQVKHIFS